MHLLDTNHCSRLMEGGRQILDRLAAIREVATSFVVRGELMFMAYNSSEPDQNVERVLTLVEHLTLYLVDEETVDLYRKLKAALVRHFGPKARRQRRSTTTRQLGFDDNDLWIAATALRHDLTIVSADTDFERIAEAMPLRLERWWMPPRSAAEDKAAGATEKGAPDA
jgi:tRNA(fMet)-specific endonuclease VapC